MSIDIPSVFSLVSFFGASLVAVQPANRLMTKIDASSSANSFFIIPLHIFIFDWSAAVKP